VRGQREAVRPSLEGGWAREESGILTTFNTKGAQGVSTNEMKIDCSIDWRGPAVYGS